VKRKFVGITGEIGSGKSYLSDLIVERCGHHYIEAHNIDFDKIAHNIYEDEFDLWGVRSELKKYFPGVVIKHKSGNVFYEEVDRKLLGDLVFNQPEKLEELNQIMSEPIRNEYNSIIKNKGGLILINSSLIAEHNMFDLCGGKCILVNVNEEIQFSRLRARGLTDKKIKKMLSSQLTNAEKHKVLVNAKIKMSYVFSNEYLKKFNKEIDIIKNFIFNKGDLL